MPDTTQKTNKITELDVAIPYKLDWNRFYIAPVYESIVTNCQNKTESIKRVIKASQKSKTTKNTEREAIT